MPIHAVANNLLKNPRKRATALIKLPFPVASTLRVAQLSAAPQFENVQPVRIRRLAEVEAYKPGVVFGGLEDFERLVEEAARERMDIDSIDRAIVVLTRHGCQPLNDLNRVRFWQAFGVPIFEMYLGLDDALLAAECEAHDGWHVETGVRFTMSQGELVLDGKGNNGLHIGLSGTLLHDVCPCGQQGMRLIDVRPLDRSQSQYLAVSA